MKKAKQKPVTKKAAPAPVKSKNPHADYAPSMLEHLEVCAGYEKESGDNIFSLEGQMLHAVCEGKTPPQPLNAEQDSCVQMCMGYVSTLIDTKESKEIRLSKHLKEVKLDMEGMTWGTADRLLIWGDGSADLIDFKFGRNSVDAAETNLQGWCYALGAMFGFPQIKSIEIHFLLPRRDEVTTHSFERGGKFEEQVRLRISTIIARRKLYEKTRPAAMLKPCPSNCIYCGAKATCQMMHSIAFRIAKKYDETFDIPSEVHSSQIQDPKEMAKAKAIAVVMDRWAGSVTEHALQMVLLGTEIPGWEIKHRAGKLRIQDAAAAFTAIKTLFNGVTLEEFISATSVSKSALDEFVSSRAEKGQKAKSVQELNEALIETGIGVRDPDTTYLGRVKS